MTRTLFIRLPVHIIMLTIIGEQTGIGYLTLPLSTYGRDRSHFNTLICEPGKCVTKLHVALTCKYDYT